MPRQCAFGCKGTGKVMHLFPNPNKFPERFKAWVNLVGEKLETLTDNDIYQKKRVCDIHFTIKHRNRFRRLNIFAIPTLYLSGEGHGITEDDHHDDDPHVDDHHDDDHHVDDDDEFKANLNFSRPTISTSLLSTSASGESCGITTFTKTRQCGAISDTHSYTNTSLLATSTSDKSQGPAATNYVEKEHNYIRNSELKQKPLHEDACVSIGARHKCEHTKPLQKKIKYLQTEINRLRKKNQTFKARLANAKKMTNESAFQKITKNMTIPARRFVRMQMQSNKKCKGRRFSIEDKKLSLSLYQKSPQCYSLLCKYFTLPSAKAMKRAKLISDINPIVSSDGPEVAAPTYEQ